MFLAKRKEVRGILITQYKQSYIKVLHSYKEMKRRRFQQYIIENASKLILKALSKNLERVNNIRSFLKQRNIKRFYFLKQQAKIFSNITNIQSKNSIIKTIRLPLIKQCKHKNLIPLLFKDIKQSVILYNFHELRKLNKETQENRDIIKYQLLYHFTQQVTVKRSQKKYKLSPNELARYQNTLKRIDKFQQEEYSQFQQVEITDINILKKIYMHNRKNLDNQIQIYFDIQLSEIAAVCRIQKFFRAIWNIKEKGMKFKKIMRLINQSRAIYVIQRWFRRIRWTHRNNFFKEISFYASQIPTQYLYLDMEFYSKIEEIISNQQYSLKFLEQFNTVFSDNETVRLQFYSQSYAHQNQSTFSKSLEQFDEFKIQVIPTWLLKQIQIVPQQELKLIDYSVIKQEQQTTKWNCRNRQYQNRQKESLIDLKFQKKSDIYGLLHLGSKITFDHINKRDYIRFCYSSTSEARYRAIALALITYKFKQNGTSLLMLSDSIWESQQHKQETFLNKYYEKISKVFKIESLKLESSKLNDCPQSKIILCSNQFQANQFNLQQNQVQLQFFSETGRVIKTYLWMTNLNLQNKKPQYSSPKSQRQSPKMQTGIFISSSFCDEQYGSINSNNINNNSIELQPESIVDGSSKSTQLPVKFSILQIENTELKFKEPKFKRRTEQSYSEFITTNRFRTQNNSLQQSKISEQLNEDNLIQIFTKKTQKQQQQQQQLDNISENTEYSQLRRRYQDQITIENKQKVAQVKVKKQNEKIFLSEFANFANLLQRQEQRMIEKQGKTQRASNSTERRTTSIVRSVKESVSKSVSRREEYCDVSIVFPKIEIKSTKKQPVSSRLSNYCRHAVFPEELYAISSNKETIKF